MDRVAVFVDAGYLFAQGNAAISDHRCRRQDLSLNAPKVISLLKEVAEKKAPDCRLLRIYWYDGAYGGARPTSEQAVIAELDDVKIRLGFINSRGQQKGVDSLIVTDLIELARLSSINDAVLLSGDEDVRVGVQIAQNYGVRVHLLGIVPSRGSQSSQLLQEADTTTEWDQATIREFLSLRRNDAESLRSPDPVVSPPPVYEESRSTGILQESITEFAQEMTEADFQGVFAYWGSERRGIPPDLDRKLLRKCALKLSRRLSDDEKRLVRAELGKLIRSSNSS